jgi:hypothetical protein
VSLNDSITALANATLTVTRMVKKTFVDGIAVAGSTTTFTIDAVVQPAFNLNRIIGGADLQAGIDLQRVETIYQIHTTTELKGRTPTTEPDVVTYKGDAYTVARVEEWDLDGEIHYHVVITKQTEGAS